MEALLNKKLYKYSNETLKDVHTLAIKKGYKVYSYEQRGNTISQIFISNGVTFGTVHEAFGGVTYSTCHKSERNSGNGTGFGMSDDCCTCNEDDLETIFAFAPRWAKNTNKIKKQTWEQYTERETILKYGELNQYYKEYICPIPFKGSIINSISNIDGVQWLDHQEKPTKLSEYIKTEESKKYEICNDEQLDAIIEKHQKGMCYKWEEITEDRYNEMLEVLPPVKWENGGFYISEAYTGQIHSFYQKHGEKYYTALVSITASRKAVIESLLIHINN